MGVAPKIRMTYAEYIAAEKVSDVRHEYLRGEVWAMAGGTREHARLCAAVSGELRAALRGRPCVVYSPDLRVRIDATDRATYPDVTVVCGPEQVSPVDPEAITNPVVLVEVLSESTSEEDRTTRFAHYRRLASLKEYVLVAQKTPLVEIYRREGDFWRYVPCGAGGAVELASLGIALSVDAVYANPLVDQ